MRSHYQWLIVIVLLSAFCLWVALPETDGLQLDFDSDGEVDFSFSVTESLGLDIIGGQRVLLRADIPEDAYTTADLEEAANNVSRRVNGLGLSEATVQVQGNTRILVELPGVTDEEEARRTIQQTAQLEFVNFSGVDSGTISLYEGQPVLTSQQVEIEQQRQALLEQQGEGTTDADDTTAHEAARELTEVETQTIAAVDTLFAVAGRMLPADVELLEPLTRGGQPFETVMTGDGLSAAVAQTDGVSWFIEFELTGEGGTVFGPFTAASIGQPMAIVLDGILISAPTIQARLDTGGVITGGFSEDEAKQLALQLRSGALPIPLSVESFSKVGATLGQESVNLSIRAGAEIGRAHV